MLTLENRLSPILHKASALLPKNHSIDLDRVVTHLRIESPDAYTQLNLHTESCIHKKATTEVTTEPTTNLISEATVESTTTTKETTKPKSPQNHLQLQTVQKMLNRFVVEKHLSIDEISHRLNIDTHKLRRLSTITYKHLASEICLPIIKLYCKTKWV